MAVPLVIWLASTCAVLTAGMQNLPERDLLELARARHRAPHLLSDSLIEGSPSGALPSLLESVRSGPAAASASAVKSSLDLPQIPDGVPSVKAPPLPVGFPVVALAERFAESIGMREPSDDVPDGVASIMESDEQVQVSNAAPQAAGGDEKKWFLWFLASAGVLTGLLWHFHRKLHADAPLAEADVVDGDLRERPCWSTCVFVICAFLAVFAFYLTVLNCRFVNKETLKNPRQVHTVDDTTVVTTRFAILNAGERAFLAGHGVALSFFIACLTMWTWRHYGSVKISNALLAKYAIRGGTVSLAAALLMESGGLMLINAAGNESDGANVSTGLVMSMVGFSEEFTKLIAVTVGTSLVLDSYTRTTRESCSAALASLVESPRALMLAGLAAGFGFMTVENAGYVMSAAMMPPTTQVIYSRNHGDPIIREGDPHPRFFASDHKKLSEDEVSAASITFWTTATIVIRVLLNVHPWWAAMSSARLAQMAYKDKRDSACLSAGEILSAFWPSALVHALYDFWITACTGPVGLLAPPVFWYFSKRHFNDDWHQWEEEAVTDENTAGHTSSAVATA
eukprot:TRINITY_DN38655_c0_g1_i1.p1 TRINITY_DN38655_c0_g1~~TRINITY_DN38655_c0_g1_i1.p1  ORF type:complete len:568 (-),score=96.37 TRINITY_DN38655_c0_g1_i1:177-1880(-)